jgi:hypothetical protein
MALGLLVALLVLWFPASAGATTYTVNTNLDPAGSCPGSHQCSLRQAIAAVNSTPNPPDVINIPAGTYILSQAGGLVIDNSVSVVGAGSSVTTINGGGGSVGRVFQFNQTSGTLSVTLSGLTITNGNPGNASGGGIETNATAHLTDVMVTGNTANGSGGGIDNTGTLTLTNSTVSNNNATGTGSTGGGIDNSSSLTLNTVTVSGNTSGGDGGGVNTSGFAPGGLFATDVTVSNNTAGPGTSGGGGGGGIRSSANAVLTRVTVVGNGVPGTGGFGGGIYNTALSPQQFSLSDSTVNGNSVGTGNGFSGGAGIANTGDSASLTRVTIGSNFATGSGEDGGGLFNSGSLALTDVAVSGNALAASSFGAGIYNTGNPFTANRVTVSGNTAGASSDGAGIWNSGNASTGSPVQLTNVTISDNALGTGGRGAGMFSSGFGVMVTNATIAGNTLADGTNAGGAWTDGTTTIANSIVAANSATNCAGGGTLTSAGHDLQGDNSCGFVAGGDITAPNPGLRALAANGGFTQTRALLPGSPATDAGDDASCPAVDQRGVTRPQGAHCDIGAYEYSPPIASASVPSCVASCVVTFTVTPTAGGSPPTAVHYTLDGATEQVIATTGNPGTASITVPVGTHALLYWGESLGGDLEAVHHSATVVVSAAPGLTPGPPVVAGAHDASFTATINPNGLLTTVHFEYGLDPSLLGLPGSAVVYDQRTSDQQVGPDFANHTVTASVTGLLPNATYHVRAVASNGAGTVAGPDQTFKTATDPPPPRPVLGKQINVFPVSGLVFIKLPGSATSDRIGGRLLGRATLTKGVGFIPLTEARQLPTGTQVDARQGRLRLQAAAATKRGKLQNGTFNGGLFKLTQDRSGLTKGLTTLSLLEGAFPGAPTYASCKAKKASDPTAPSAFAALSSSVLQTLRSSAHGKFRTRGRYAAAVVRGTAWTMSDRCDGTLVTVQRDTVAVQDFVRHVTVLVRAGHRYLARASRKSKR